MKIGIIISAVIIAVIAGAIIFMSSSGSPDAPTNYSAPKMLEARTLSTLPPIVELATGDATAVYNEMMAFYEQSKSSLDTIDSAPAEVADKAVDLMIKAHDTGVVTGKYLDDQLPLTPNPRAGTNVASLQVIAAVVLDRADELHKHENPEHKAKAEKAVKAVIAMGVVFFEKSNRVPIRAMGFAMIQAGGDKLFSFLPDGHELKGRIAQWEVPMKDLGKYWEDKSEVTHSLRLKTTEVKATIGDLLKYASEDKDQAWRIESVLSLGRAKFMRDRGKANDKAIRDAIEKLKQDKDATIAAAAAAAEAYTAEEMKRN